MTDEEWQRLIHRPQSGYDEREAEYFRIIAEWETFRRRDEANIFDVMFREVSETIGWDEVKSIVLDISKTLDVPMPVVNGNGEALAYIKSVMQDGREDLSLYYNWEMLREAGINNVDAFTLVVVHEMSHRFFRNRYFGLCDNESWSQELACDYMTGIIAKKRNLASGKYKWAVGRMYCGKSHPPGDIRKNVVAYAMKEYDDMRNRKEMLTIENCLAGFTAFMMMNGGKIKLALSVMR